MTVEQFAAIVREWATRMEPRRVKACARGIASCVYDWPLDIGVEEALRCAGLPEGIINAPAMTLLEELDMEGPLAALGPAPPATPASASERRRDVVRAEPTPKPAPGVSKRARELLRAQLADGPRPASQIEAAAEAANIPERTLIAAASVLGVRTQRGQWWLPR
jgi:hypothetical protein